MPKAEPHVCQTPHQHSESHHQADQHTNSHKTCGDKANKSKEFLKHKDNLYTLLRKFRNRISPAELTNPATDIRKIFYKLGCSCFTVHYNAYYIYFDVYMCHACGSLARFRLRRNMLKVKSLSIEWIHIGHNLLSLKNIPALGWKHDFYSHGDTTLVARSYTKSVLRGNTIEANSLIYFQAVKFGGNEKYLYV